MMLDTAAEARVLAWPLAVPGERAAAAKDGRPAAAAPELGRPRAGTPAETEAAAAAAAGLKAGRHGNGGGKALGDAAVASGGVLSLACSETLSSSEDECQESTAPARQGAACKRRKTGAAARGPTVAQLKAR